MNNTNFRKISFEVALGLGIVLFSNKIKNWNRVDPSNFSLIILLRSISWIQKAPIFRIKIRIFGRAFANRVTDYSSSIYIQAFSSFNFQNRWIHNFELWRCFFFHFSGISCFWWNFQLLVKAEVWFGESFNCLAPSSDRHTRDTEYDCEHNDQTDNTHHHSEWNFSS